ncbi:hypothetical protein SADUNF_Sadunf05G0188500 [Salix dunnii]|uniref:Uncharacterized protein n=1 Tax=Salix dunnii TaxID=1413687 RepID=A0A835KC31_9ROSI|nr:hypothetical protein SADUNF_Sadunf05G0188500 [Salix dunnii]
MICRQLREAFRATLISNGGGESNEETHITASTLYGPLTLSAYIQEFNNLALTNGEVTGALLPADYVSKPTGGSFNKDDRQRDTFWSANPKNDLLIEGIVQVIDATRTIVDSDIIR